MASFLLRGARQLLTLQGSSSVRRGVHLRELGIIQDGSVLIRDGSIVSLGSTRRLENLKEAREAIDIPVHGRVLMPAFVDAGLRLSLSRSETSYKPKRVAEFHEDSLNLLRACLQHGTVTADIKAGADGRDYHSDIAVLRQLAKIGSNPVRMRRTWRIASRSGLPQPNGNDDLWETLDALLRRRFVEAVMLCPRGENDWDDEALQMAQAANISLSLSWPGGDAGLLGTILDRLSPGHICFSTVPDPAEIAVLSRAGQTAVLAAGKRLFEGPVGHGGRNLVDSGVGLALSSGYHSSHAPSFSMQMSIALAVTRLGLTVEEAITAATVNAAMAIGCGEVTGSLEVGKQADLLVLNVPDYREIPEQFGMNHVAMVFRSGNMVINRTRWRPPTEQPANRVRSQLL